MREIKLRAWNKDSNCWYSMDGLTFENGKLVYPEGIVVMQFTGLKDREDKEIWEGDVIKVCFSAFVPNSDHVVEYDEGFARFVGRMIERQPHSDYHQDRIYTFHPSTWCEVLGNIYENKELLT